MNKSSQDIIDIVRSVVVQMTPFVEIESIDTVGSDYKLNTCNTYWITLGSKVTIDGVIYKVIDYSHNEFITVSGSVSPTADLFQLDAPDFYHGSHRKVSNARNLKNDLRNTFIYLPIPRVSQDNDIESDYSYHANIRPIFLIPFNTSRDTIEQQQEEAIKPMESMASLFVDLINLDLARFKNPDEIEETYHPNFGDPVAWGNDKLIFDQPLSGVQISFVLDVYDGVDCSCSSAPPITCAPVQVKLNNVLMNTTLSGQTFQGIIQDTDGNPIGTKLNDTTWEVLDNDTTLNDTPLVPTPSGQEKVIDITYFNGDPLTITTDVDTANLFQGTVPDAGQIPINTSNLIKTGANQSYFSGDDGWYQEGRDDTTTLSYLNPFGTYERYTDRFGGQDYTDDIICDWGYMDQVTGDFLMWYRVNSLFKAIYDAIPEAAAANHGGLSGWRLPNFYELVSQFSFKTSTEAVKLEAFTHHPLNISYFPGIIELWTSTFGIAGSRYITINVQGKFISFPRPTAQPGAGYIPVRNANISEL